MGTQAAWTYSGWCAKKTEGACTTDGVDITVHGACAATPDSPGQPWCYVDSSKNCKYAMESQLYSDADGMPLHYRFCDPTACRGAWTWKAHGAHAADSMHNGCLPDNEWGAWCYTQGRSPYAAMAKASLNDQEHNHWKNCNPCACQNKWEYTQPDYTKKDDNGKWNVDLLEDGKTLNTWNSRCWPDPKYIVDDKATAWCYVEGYYNCKKDSSGEAAKQSGVLGEHRYFVLCGKETCGNHKDMYKNSECCGAPTKAWPLQMALSMVASPAI